MLKPIEDATCLLPELIADCVVNEVCAIAGPHIEDNREPLVEYLAKKSRQVYAGNAGFRKSLKGRDGREWLYAFMRHWCAAFMKSHMYADYSKLPSSFCNGEEVRT